MTDTDSAAATKVIHYFADPDELGTSHIVREERETEVDTACGRTLRKELGVSIRRAGGYVSEYGETQVSDQEQCGNCPWTEVTDD